MPIEKQIEKIDAYAKVKGEARYAADFYMEGLIYGAILRSKRPHALIKKIDTRKAESLDGILRIIQAKDVPGENSFGIIRKDQPLLCDKKVRFVGDAILIVLAEKESLARKAVDLIDVEYEDLEVINDPLVAERSSTLIHESGNLLTEKFVIKGDVDLGFDASDIIVERTYKTTWLDHAYLEPEAAFGFMDEKGRIVIYSSTQNVHYKRKEISRILKIPEEKIRIIQAETGGGFGGKLDMTVEGYVALSVFHTGRPVLIRYTREESFLVNTKRHPLIITYKTGAKKDGTLQAVKVDIVGDTGAYASYGETVCLRAAIHATGPYEVPNVYVRSRMFYTNNQISGAMRGFGVPQVAFAHESQMDILAEQLSIDPLYIRMKNGLRKGSKTATSQVLESSVGYLETLKRIEPIWTARNRKKNRGFGLGSMFYGIGNTGIPNPSFSVLRLSEDGKIILYTGACDIGQGSNTVFLQVLCEVIGIEPTDVEIVHADTDFTKDAGSTSASRQTYISGRATYNAALKLREFLEAEGFYRGRSLKEIARKHKESGSFVFEGFFDPPTTPLDPQTSAGKPYATYAYATHMTEVEVDSAVGYVKVIKVYAAHDVGCVINKEGVKGQICGGIAMGIGFALMEEYVPQRTRSFSDYYIPTSLDMPEVEIFLVEDEEPTGPFGAKGVGEPALIPQAASIVNAIYDATGIRPYELPCDIERLKLLMEKKGGA
ncbi:MAG: xanthine dehydrogenase family protein molybdopterin-binding subunit [Desulfobacterota bacterium]|nr:xanthine dehydrogenase family protein molybdopterin-binding subunit [Thermodesulfobacteriota bacterium]MDW8002519.1 xanthine dehydrogenase family protein molybdopterin-binding subunit [Deltaproteobacteria bacterium]